MKLLNLIPNKYLKEAINTEYKIYVDMDGVLTDFEKAFADISNGQDPTEYEDKNGTHKFWSHIDIAGIEYWTNMEWMPDGKYLWQFVKPYHPIILSTPSKNPTSRKGKIIWCKRELGSTEVILEKHKYKYATPTSILIDDRIKNIKLWRQAGGLGILHKDASTTITKLKNIIVQK